MSPVSTSALLVRVVRRESNQSIAVARLPAGDYYGPCLRDENALRYPRSALSSDDSSLPTFCPDPHTNMRRWIEHTRTHNYSTAMPPCIVSQNRNNPDFLDNLVDGSYSVEVVLEREACEYEHYNKPLLHRLPTMSSKAMEPQGNDVLMGRGGKNNQWRGNEKLRAMARTQAENYRMSSKKGKSYISRELVRRVRELDPPGRFLKKDDAGGWEDVGDEVAREKASQVLRDAVAVEINSPNIASEGELKMGMEILSTNQNRSSSAPPVMATARRRRDRDWEAQPPTPTRSMSSVSHFAQRTHQFSPKRRRYYDNAWVAHEQQENHPPMRHQAYYSYERYVVREGFSRYHSYPTEQARYRPEYPAVPPSVSIEPADDFDLFNGELLRSDTESPDIEVSGSF